MIGPDKFAGNNVTPVATLTDDVGVVFDGIAVMVALNISIDVAGAKLKRCSFSILFDASGVGMRGRFFNGPDVLIDPLRLIFESVYQVFGIFWFFYTFQD